MKLHVSRPSCLISCVALLSCSSGLNFFNGPDEPALPPSDAPLWQELSSIRSDNWYHLLSNGEEAVTWRLRSMDSATSSIDLQTFLWGADPIGRTFVSRLLHAADRGVRVRILLDDSFLVHEDEIALALNSHSNIEFRVYNPNNRRSGGMVVRELLNAGDFSRVNHRMHNKSQIVDGRIAILGGRNIADHYFGYNPRMNFRDMEVMTGGPGVKSLSKGFDTYWNDHWAIPITNIAQRESAATTKADLASLKKKVDRPSPAPKPLSAPQRSEAWRIACRNAHAGKPRLLIDRPPHRDPAKQSEAPVQVAHEIEKLFDRANSELVLISAYFIPTPELEQAIERAESRGVQVRVLTNSIRSNNHVAAHAAYRHHIKQIVSHGADLHEVMARAKDRGNYMVGPVGSRTLGLHAKILIIDSDKVFIGSANLDPRSLRLNTEMGLVIESTALNQQVRTSFQPDFSPRNAWHVKFNESGGLIWVGDGRTLTSEPAASAWQRLEDWISYLLPFQDQM